MNHRWLRIAACAATLGALMVSGAGNVAEAATQRTRISSSEAVRIAQQRYRGASIVGKPTTRQHGSNAAWVVRLVDGRALKEVWVNVESGRVVRNITVDNNYRWNDRRDDRWDDRDDRWDDRDDRWDDRRDRRDDRRDHRTSGHAPKGHAYGYWRNNPHVDDSDRWRGDKDRDDRSKSKSKSKDKKDKGQKSSGNRGRG